MTPKHTTLDLEEIANVLLTHMAVHEGMRGSLEAINDVGHGLCNALEAKTAPKTKAMDAVLDLRWALQHGQLSVETFTKKRKAK